VDPAIHALPGAKSRLEDLDNDVSVRANLYINAWEAFVREVRELGEFDYGELNRLRESMIAITHRARAHVPEKVLRAVVAMRGVAKRSGGIDGANAMRQDALVQAAGEQRMLEEQASQAVRHEEMRAAELDRQAETLRELVVRPPQPGEQLPMIVAEVREQIRRNQSRGVLLLAVGLVVALVTGVLVASSWWIGILVVVAVMAPLATGVAVWMSRPLNQLEPMRLQFEQRAQEIITQSERMWEQQKAHAMVVNRGRVSEIELAHSGRVYAVQQHIERLRLANENFFKRIGGLNEPQARMVVPSLATA
jgi:hypothetical protein